MICTNSVRILFIFSDQKIEVYKINPVFSRLLNGTISILTLERILIKGKLQKKSLSSYFWHKFF